MNWNRQIVDKKLQEGKIRGYHIPERTVQKGTPGRIVTKHFPKRSKEKDWMGWNLLYWTNAKMLELQEEYHFHPTRKWRSDFCIPALRVLIEWEGIISDKSRHTTVKGYSGDADKYREASKMGFIILRYTVLNYQQVLSDLNEILIKNAAAGSNRI